MFTHTNYSRGFISTAVLGVFALLLFAGVHVFETLSTESPSQNDLTALSTYGHLADNPGQGSYGSWGGTSSGYSGNGGSDSPSESAGGPGSKGGGTSSSGSKGGGTSSGGSSSSSSGGKSSGGAAGTNSGSSNSGSAGREGQTSGPGGGANSGGGFGPGPNTASGYSREGQTSGPGGAANSGNGFGPGPNTASGYNREGQTSGPGGGANSGGGFGPDTNTPDSPVQAGIKSIIDSIVKGVIPGPNTPALTTADQKGRPTSMAQAKNDYPSLFDPSKFTLDNDVNFVGIDPNTLANLVATQQECKCNIHITEGVVTSGHVTASAHKSAYGASAVDVTISLKEVSRVDFISAAKRAGFARIGEYIANGKPAVFHLDMHPATNGYASTWNYSYKGNSHTNHTPSPDMTKGLADAAAKGPLGRDTGSASGGGKTTSSSNTSSGSSKNTGNNPGNPNASGYQGDISGPSKSGGSTGSTNSSGGLSGSANTSKGSAGSGSITGREGQTSGPGGGANSGGGFGPGTTGGGTTGSTGSTGSGAGKSTTSNTPSGGTNTGNNPGNPNASGYQGNTSGTASGNGSSASTVSPSQPSQKDIQTVFDTRVPGATAPTTPAKNPVTTPVDSEGYKAIIAGINTGTLDEPKSTNVQDGVSSIVAGIKNGTISGPTTADRNKELSFNTPSVSTPKNTGVVGSILSYVGVPQKTDPFTEVIKTAPGAPVELTKETGGIPQDEHESTGSDVGVLCRWFSWRCPTIPVVEENLTPVNSTVPLTEI